MFEIFDKGASKPVYGSSYPGGRPDHHDRGYEQGAYGHDPRTEQAPLELADFGRGPWPRGRGVTQIKLIGPPPRRLR